MKPNWPLLAALRFVLALIVVLFHAKFLLFPAGGAVAAFLVLSGYSINESCTTRPQGYFARRALRILPIYHACFALSLLPYVAIAFTRANPASLPDFDPAQFIGAACMLQLHVTEVPVTFGPAWSLAVEVAFYFAAPLLVRLTPRAVWYLAALSATCFALHALADGPILHEWGPLTTPCFAWLWLLGWQIRHYQRNAAQISPVVPAAIAVAAPFVISLDTTYFSLLRYDWLILTITLISLFISHKITMSQRASRLAILGGDLSYPLYLAHIPMYWLLLTLLPTTSAGLFIIASLTTSAALLYAVDYPARRIKI